MKYAIDVISPVYHEQDNITTLINGINKYRNLSLRISLIVQDPNDPTIPIINKLIRSHPNVRMLKTKNGKGLGKAIKCGLENATAPYVILTMSDLSDDPKEIPLMLEKLKEGFDIVCASRYLNPGKKINDQFLKGTISRLACLSLRILLRLPTHDATNAYKAFNRKKLSKIKIEGVHGFEIPLEILIKAFFLGMKITEVPTIWTERLSGQSQFKFFQLMPYYLKWYWFGIKKKIFN